MAHEIVLVDTSILIEYFRKSEKSHSSLIKLLNDGYDFCISAITEYEIYSDATPHQLDFWKEILNNVKVIAFDQTAVNINNNLKRKRKQIDLADLFIAATAVANSLKFVTLNRKHFDRIDELQILN